MARHMRLEPEPAHRAVILYWYPGMYYPQGDWAIQNQYPQQALPPEKTYTTATGESFVYHTASCYGPYAAKAQATSAITREAVMSDQHTTHAFVERAVPGWSKL